MTLDRQPSPSDAGRAGVVPWPSQELRLPSAPDNPIVCLNAADRPQPRLDVDREDGMTRPSGV
jgi:hypothetical protein